jgi:hypothetical protein
MQTRCNHPLQNKRNDLLLRTIRTRRQNTLNTIANVLVQVSVLSCPLMPLVDQHFRTHFKSYKLRTNTKPHKQQKKVSTSLNSSTKATNNQNKLHKMEKKANTLKLHHTFIEAIP